MQEVDKILYSLGYYNDDPLKKKEIQSYMNEANEFMTSSGVQKKEITSTLAGTIRHIWVDARDKGETIDLTGKDKMILNILSQLKRRR